MAIKELNIKGFRGFNKERTIKFAIPDKKNIGSGLTILVGPNNSGKSTIIEAVHLLSKDTDTIPRSMRNEQADGVRIECIDTDNNSYCLESTENKGAFVERIYNGEVQVHHANAIKPFILSSKRNVTSTFGNNYQQTRENYHGNVGNNDYRTSTNNNQNFGGRLLKVMKNKKIFDSYLAHVVYPAPEWTVDAIDSNNLYLEFLFNGTRHNSNGSGDGFINIFNIIDSIYDSVEDNIIFIDEPEISLHPDLQKKLFELLIEHSKDKQIIISTHSPYFINWDIVANNSKIIRVEKNSNNVDLYELSDESKNNIKVFLNNYYNPHILGLDASEFFFLNDNIILVEGQDDIICYKKIFDLYKFKPFASFFGWEVGGAENMTKIINMLKELGYSKIFCILDGDKKDMVEELSLEYPEYCFHSIPTKDVRTKEDKQINGIIKEINTWEFEQSHKEKIINLLNKKAKNTNGLIKSYNPFTVDDTYDKDINEMINKIKEYFIIEIPEVLIEDKDYVGNKNDNNKEYNDELANSLFNEYVRKNKLFEIYKKMYPQFQFEGGGTSGPPEKIKKNKYRAIIKCGGSISEKQFIKLKIYLIIDTRAKKVKLARKKIIENTLPISHIRRLIEKIFY